MCGNNLSYRCPGAISHARWLTTANRILRLYAATLKPCQELKDLVKFILTVYAPAWFNIKHNSSCTRGTMNLFEVVRSCQYLKGAQKNVVQKSIQNNAYYCHPENIILAMLFDKDEFVRKKAVDLIEKTSTIGDKIRKFIVPQVNFNATSYLSLINFNELVLTVPPVVANFTRETLEELHRSDVGKNIWKIPCHSQAVERSVKLVTEASAAVTESNRHGHILNKVSSRAKISKFESKKDFISQ